MESLKKYEKTRLKQLTEELCTQKRGIHVEYCFFNVKDKITNRFCLYIIFLGGESVVCKDAIVKPAHEVYHYLTLSRFSSNFRVFEVIQNCALQMT